MFNIGGERKKEGGREREKWSGQESVERCDGSGVSERVPGGESILGSGSIPTLITISYIVRKNNKEAKINLVNLDKVVLPSWWQSRTDWNFQDKNLLRE